MFDAHQSRKKIVSALVLVIVAAGAFIILRPRLWVKNKTAEVTVDGRLSEGVKLYHGSDDRLLFYLRADPAHAYYFSANAGVMQCETSAFTPMKLMVFSAHAHPRCEAAAPTAVFEPQSLQFTQGGHNIIVSWQPAPR